MFLLFLSNLSVYLSMYTNMLELSRIVEVCTNKFLDHQAYHLVYHYMCTFCSADRHRLFEIRDEEEYWDNFLETRDLESRSCQVHRTGIFDPIS